MIVSEGEHFMEYSASGVKYLLWFVETRETARLLKDHSPDEVREMALNENIYQQKDRSRIINEYGCIIRRLQAIPESLNSMLLDTDVATAKIIVLVSAMASDRLLFELMHEVYQSKIHLGEEEWKDSDLNIFFSNKADQSDLIAGWTEATIKKLKQAYTRCLLEAGALKKESARIKKIQKLYIDPELRQILLKESMGDYLYALTGER